MERASIKETLDSLAQEHGAGERDLWPRVDAQIRHSAPRGAYSSEWLPLPNAGTMGAARVKQARLALGLTAAMSAMLVLFGGVALALGWMNSAPEFTRAGVTLTPTTTVGGSISPTPKVDPTPTAHAVRWGFRGYDNIYSLSTIVGVTEKRGGYNVTLERAYADANSIVIFYSIWSDSGVRMTNLRTESPLTLPDGTVKPITYEGRESALTSGSVGLPQSSRTTYLMAFDAHDIGDLPNSLSLTVTLHVLDVIKYEEAHSKTIDPSTMPKESSAALRALAEEFTFSFDVPVTKSRTRIVEVNESIAVNGETVTLERVIITPSEFRAILRYSKAAEDADKYTRRAQMWLVTGDPELDNQQQVPPVSYGYSRGTSDGRLAHTLVWPLADASGDWTLNLYSLELDQIRHTVDTSTYPPPKVVTGPWQFRFMVSPAGD